uniref:Polypeptide N-acetylgalactosaminyltransferase n=1 Tax=Lygus hesperus TaxID=30085 RepID=A0A0A9ZCM1_LYGHE
MKVEAFNLVLSQKIPYNRTLQDVRHPNCKNMQYPEDLPSVSVIIIFTDERWSTLIRTIHSVINMSPERYLKEIILVDDFSAHDELKGKLDYYIKTRFPSYVKLLRLPKRSGLIRARLEGARAATSEVLLFLDAHCEVTVDWLPPLLARIKEDRKNVVVPIIDVIDDKNFQYQNNGGTYDFEVGGFTWNGHFTWIETPPEEARRRKSLAHPTRTPTMAGGLFAIDRKYFWEVGSYDEQMDIWGGENLEMSFRIWQCGGNLETIPCSRVGHIFRNFHPYKFPGEKDTHGINTARFVRVWWDDYQRLFFQMRPELEHTDIGDITERSELKKRLKCKPFSWYLKHIYKKFIPDEDVIGWGRARTKEDICLDNLQKDEESNQDLGVFPCNSELSRSQYFSLSKKGEIRREFTCARIKSKRVPSTVELEKCDGSADQQWRLTQDGLLVHTKTDLCLDGKKDSSGLAHADYCHPNRDSQLWTWENEPNNHKR